MAEIGFAKKEEKPEIPHAVERALRLQEKLKKKMERLMHDFQSVYTQRNHLERIIANEEPVCISILDNYTYTNSLKIDIPNDVAKKLLTQRQKELDKEFDELEHKVTELINVIEELFGADDE